MGRLGLFVACLLWPILCRGVDVQPYIVNGSTANIANYPSFASLFYRTDSVYSINSFCGATVINANYILTAAHCIYGSPNTMLYTVIAPQLDDENDFLNSEQVRAQAFYYPNNYVDTESALWANDIAIIKTESALNVADYSRFLNTTYNNTYPQSGQFIAIGHGFIEGNQQGGTELLETELNLVGYATCRAYFGQAVTRAQLCFSGEVSGGYQNSTCSGDSGGPVYWFDGADYHQVGLASFGTSVCGEQNATVTSVFTELYDYQDWINQVINGLIEPKYYVSTVDGQRVLIQNGATTQPEVTSTSSGGGVLDWKQITLFVCILILRHCASCREWRVLLPLLSRNLRRKVPICPNLKDKIYLIND